MIKRTYSSTAHGHQNILVAAYNRLIIMTNPDHDEKLPKKKMKQDSKNKVNVNLTVSS
jgi:hypothetical protein